MRGSLHVSSPTGRFKTNRGEVGGRSGTNICWTLCRVTLLILSRRRRNARIEALITSACSHANFHSVPTSSSDTTSTWTSLSTFDKRPLTLVLAQPVSQRNEPSGNLVVDLGKHMVPTWSFKATGYFSFNKVVIEWFAAVAMMSNDLVNTVPLFFAAFNGTMVFPKSDGAHRKLI